MEAFKYKEVIPIERPMARAFLAKFEDGTQRLYVLAKEFTIPEVVDMIKVHHKKFTVKAMDVGEFIIAAVDHSYTGDGRGVNQDMEIVL